MLWWWCCDYATDGRLDRYIPEQIAEAAGWEGNAGEFLQHMADTGFINRDPLCVHDWQSYRLHYDDLQARKDRNLKQLRRRVSRWRNRNAVGNAPVTQDSPPTIKTLQTLPNQPNQTLPNQPNQTLPNQPNVFRRKPKVQRAFVPPTVQEVADYVKAQGLSINAEAFVNHYGAAGWMRGKTKITNWKMCVQTWKNHGGFDARKSEPIRHSSDDPERAKAYPG